MHLNDFNTKTNATMHMHMHMHMRVHTSAQLLFQYWLGGVFRQPSFVAYPFRPLDLRTFSYGIQ